MKQYSQGFVDDTPCVLEDGEAITREDIVKLLNKQAYSIKFLLNSLDSISSGFGETKYELENYAEQKLIEHAKK